MRTLFTLCALSFLIPAVPAYADEGAEVQLLDLWSTVFAESRVVYRVASSSAGDGDGRLTWSLLVKGAAIARGEMPMAPVHEVALDIPPVREGFRVEGRLRVTLLDARGRTQAELEHPIHIYAKEPFTHRREWLKDLNLHVFDPLGDTTERLDEMDVPYRPIGNPAAFELLEDAVLLVGEGISLIEYRGLQESMIRAAQQGVPVIALAPAEGQFVVPGTREDHAAPSLLMFRDRTIIRELDKKLDAESWAPDGRMIRSAWQLGGERGVVRAAVTDGAGWPWMEARYAEGGALLICGFAVTEKWEDSPTPRFLLARMLEYATTEEEENEE